MKHITYQGAQTTVDEQTCALFVAIERVTCSTPSCGGLRGAGARVRNRFGQASQARPLPQVGRHHGGAWCSSAPDLHVGLPPVNLPPDSTQRIRSLPASALLHISSSCRLRMTAAVAQCWQGMARGIDEYSQLEEGRLKVQLSPVPPPGLGAAAEVAKRLTLWEERRFEDLLRRNTSCSIADQARGSNAAVRTPPSLGPTELAGHPLLPGRVRLTATRFWSLPQPPLRQTGTCPLLVRAPRHG